MTTEDGRCWGEEGHDTGVGTPHLFAAPRPVSAGDAARELSQRMGIPCTAVPVLADEGDVTCATADGTPEGSVAQLEALWRASDERWSAGGHLIGWESRRDRVLQAIRHYLEESERDWQTMSELPNGRPLGLPGAFGAVESTANVRLDTVEEAKQLHDAQLAELFERIGAVL